MKCLSIKQLKVSVAVLAIAAAAGAVLFSPSSAVPAAACRTRAVAPGRAPASRFRRGRRK